MKIKFFGPRKGNSGISIYSQELAAEIEKKIQITHEEPFSLLKPEFLNQLFLDPIKIRKADDSDLIHVSNQDLMSGIYIDRSKTLVVTVHDIFPYMGFAGPVYSLMAKRYVRNIEECADRLIAISEATKEQILENLDISEEKVDVVYQGVDLKKFRPVNKDTGYDEFFLHVGHELDRKNIEGLIEVFEKIKKERPDSKLVRVGNDDRSREILKESNLALGEDVVHEEDIDFERLAALYSGAEKLLFTSEAEGFGRPMLESLACGTPVIAYDRKPMNEVLPNKMLVEWEDTESFANKALDEEKMDCRSIAQNFTWEKTSEETIEVYHKCLKQQ